MIHPTFIRMIRQTQKLCNDAIQMSGSIEAKIYEW